MCAAYAGVELLKKNYAAGCLKNDAKSNMGAWLTTSGEIACGGDYGWNGWDAYTLDKCEGWVFPTSVGKIDPPVVYDANKNVTGIKIAGATSTNAPKQNTISCWKQIRSVV